jgi:hypothetical protein
LSYSGGRLVVKIRINMSLRLCVVLGLFLLVSGLVISPEWFEILMKPSQLPRLFPPREIYLIRIFLCTTGVAILCTCGIWHFAREKSRRLRLESDFGEYCQSHDTYVRHPLRFVRFWTWFSFLITAALILTVYLSFIFHRQGVTAYDLLTMESGFWEALTAVSLAVSGVLLAYAAIRFRGGEFRRLTVLPVLSLGLMLIIGAGEEVSWGQHWIGFETPPDLKSINAQEEFNFHNINSHLFNHLMVAFFLAYGVLLPCLSALSIELRYIIDRLRIPVWPPSFVPFAMIGVSMNDHPIFQSLWLNPPWSLSEARETLFGILILGVSIGFYIIQKQNHQTSSGRKDLNSSMS